MLNNLESGRVPGDRGLQEWRTGLLCRSIVWMLVSALLWIMINEADTESWLVGGPTVLVAGLLSALVPPQRATPGGIPSPMALAGFLPFFVRASIAGAWDVAVRALRPRMGVHPGFVTYELRLPPGPARVFFLDIITLLPGTLSVDVGGNRAIVHALDAKSLEMAELIALEARAGKVFGLELEAA